MVGTLIKAFQVHKYVKWLANNVVFGSELTKECNKYPSLLAIIIFYVMNILDSTFGAKAWIEMRKSFLYLRRYFSTAAQP